MPERVNDPRTLEDWMVRMEQRVRELEARRLDAGTGLTQDHATKQMHAKLSDDPGNAAMVGSDGGIYATNTDTITTAAAHSPLYCQKYLSSNATVNSGTDTDIIWSAQVVSGTWTTTSTDITIPEAGNYLITLAMQWQNTANGGIRALKVYTISGSVTTTSIASNTVNPLGSHETAQNLVAIKDFSAGTVLRVSAFQDSGVTLTAGGPYFGDIRGRWTVLKLFDADPPALDQTTE